MQADLPRRSTPFWRVIVFTLTITALYLLLQHIELLLFGMAFEKGAFDWVTASRFDSEAEKVAAASREALARLPPESRIFAWRLGFQLGYVSEYAGSVAMSEPAVREKANQLVAPRMNDAERLARALGVGRVSPLAVRNIQEFGSLRQRIETDESGIGGRIAEKLSPYHRHLFLLGMHIGSEMAMIEATQGTLTNPPRDEIRRHAGIVGIQPQIWAPLTESPSGEQPQQVWSRYQNGIAAIEHSIAELAKHPRP